MPHVHLETTSDLFENAHIPDILEGLIQVIANQKDVDPASIRAYHSIRPVWAVGAGAPSGFAHVEVRVVTGHSLEWRQKLRDAIIAELRKRFEFTVASHEGQVTLEIREMLHETYLRA